MTIYLVVREAIGCGCDGCTCPDLRESHIVGVFAGLVPAQEAVLNSMPSYRGSHWEREPATSTVFRDGREVAAWRGMIKENGFLRRSPWADRIRRFEVDIDMLTRN
jgi:hypothetical protein